MKKFTNKIVEQENLKTVWKFFNIKTKMVCKIKKSSMRQKE